MDNCKKRCTWALASFESLNLGSLPARFTNKNSNSTVRVFYSVSRVRTLVAKFTFCFDLSPKGTPVLGKVCFSNLLSFTESCLSDAYLNTLLLARTVAVKNMRHVLRDDA